MRFFLERNLIYKPVKGIVSLYSMELEKTKLKTVSLCDMGKIKLEEKDFLYDEDRQIYLLNEEKEKKFYELYEGFLVFEKAQSSSLKKYIFDASQFYGDDDNYKRRFGTIKREKYYLADFASLDLTSTVNKEILTPIKVAIEEDFLNLLFKFNFIIEVNKEDKDLSYELNLWLFYSKSENLIV